MAGISIVVGASLSRSDVSEGLALLHHDETFTSEVLYHDRACLIAATYRRDEPPMDAVDDHAGLAVAVTGNPIDPRQRRSSTANDVLAGYRQRGLASITALDGGFVVVVLDLAKRRLAIANDRTATHPMHIQATAGAVCLAPEAKTVLRLLKRPPRLDAIGALEFLSLGYAVGTRTLFDDVQLLGPASLVEIDLDGALASVTRYWDLHFVPMRRPNAGRLAGELFERLSESVAAALTPSPRRRHLLLTGGYDSRTLLALMHQAGRPPDLALTWGVRDDIPGSDPMLANALATAHGTPFSFIEYDHDGFCTQARRWTYVSELASENLGNFAAGPELLRRHAPDSSVVLIGDQIFGAGGIPLDRDDAILMASGLAAGGLAASVESVAPGTRRAEIARLVRDGVAAIAAAGPSGAPKDLHDYLWFHLRVCRWLNAPTFFREPMVAPRRPMLHGPMLELFSELPPAWRVDRRLLIAMLRTRLPHLLDVPIPTANSLVDWDDAFTGTTTTAACFASLVQSDYVIESPLAPFLDRDLIAASLERYRRDRPGPMRRSGSQRHLGPTLRRALSSATVGSLLARRAQRLLGRRTTRRAGATAARALKRIALLGLLLELLDRGWFVNGPPGTPTTSHGSLASRWTASFTHYVDQYGDG